LYNTLSWARFTDVLIPAVEQVVLPVAGAWSLRNECGRIESLHDQPHPHERLPQSARNRGSQTQAGSQEFRHHPKKNDGVANEAPDGYPARDQLCPVEQVVKHETSCPESDHADRVGINARLYRQGALGLKEESVGDNCFQVLTAQWYLQQYEENIDGNKDGVNDPGSEVADGYALAALLQDREHDNLVSGVARDGEQPEDRADCYDRAVRRNRGKVIGRTKNGLDESGPHKAYDKPAR